MSNPKEQALDRALAKGLRMRQTNRNSQNEPGMSAGINKIENRVGETRRANGPRVGEHLHGAPVLGPVGALEQNGHGRVVKAHPRRLANRWSID